MAISLGIYPTFSGPNPYISFHFGRRRGLFLSHQPRALPRRRTASSPATLGDPWGPAISPRGACLGPMDLTQKWIENGWITMTNWDYWWLLMIIDDYWWLLMIIDDYWWLLMIIDDYWWLLMIIDDYWWLLMIIDDYWWLLMIIDDYWWLLMIIDDYWWLLMIIDDYWDRDGWSLNIRELSKKHMRIEARTYGDGSKSKSQDWLEVCETLLGKSMEKCCEKEGIHWLIRSIISKLAISIHFGVVINPHRGYIYDMVIDLKVIVIVKSFNCEDRSCYAGNPRESFFASSRKISFYSRKLDIMNHDYCTYYTLQLLKFVKGLRATTSFHPGVRQENGTAHLPFPS